MELRTNATKSETFISSRGSTKPTHNMREAKLNTLRAATATTTTAKKNSNDKSKLNEFNELPKHVMDEKRLQNFQIDMHQKIISRGTEEV
jgi:hypothetical protein